MTGWQKLTGPVGAARSDLAALEVDPGTLLADLRRHRLLVLRQQDLDPGRLVELAARLGTPAIYPFAEPLPGFPQVVRLVREASDASNFGGAWHTDTAYLAEPPAITLLQAVDVPEQGGDTLFADMAGAFQRLTPGFQKMLSTLTGVNTASLVHETEGDHASLVGESVTLKDAQVATEAEHPLVIDHQGVKALYFSLIHTSRFVGMSRQESLPLLRQLHELATTASNTSRLHWEPGTLAIWDNRALQHYALDDYPSQRREMQRIIMQGDRPQRAA